MHQCLQDQNSIDFRVPIIYRVCPRFNLLSVGQLFSTQKILLPLNRSLNILIFASPDIYKSGLNVLLRAVTGQSCAAEVLMLENQVKISLPLPIKKAENLGIHKKYACVWCERKMYYFFRQNMSCRIWTLCDLCWHLSFTLLLSAKQSSNNPFFLGWKHTTGSWQTFSGGVTPGPGNQCICCSQIGYFIMPSPGMMLLLRWRQLFPSVDITWYDYILQVS